jgi:uncharacterized protein YecT (DUF1311 family)
MQNCTAHSDILSQQWAFVSDRVTSPRPGSSSVGSGPAVTVVWNGITPKTFMPILLAFVLWLPFKPALAQGGWLTQCLNDTASDLSDADCYVEYTNRLKREQAGVVRRIKSAISRQGPAETDYPKALTLLNQSQKKWLSLVATDCAIVTEVFGAGNAVGFAEQTCVIEHYRARNAQLKKFEADFLSNSQTLPLQSRSICMASNRNEQAGTPPVSESLNQAELRALAYFAVGVSSEGSNRGRDVSHELALAGNILKDGTLRPIGNSGYSLGMLQKDIGQHRGGKQEKYRFTRGSTDDVPSQVIRIYQEWARRQRPKHSWKQALNQSSIRFGNRIAI